MKIFTIPQFSTYARAILSDLKNLANVIRKYAPGKAGGPVAAPPLLQQSQIEEALLNPQNSILLSMAAQAAVIKMHHAILNTREQAEAQRRLVGESLEKLQEREKVVTNELQKDQLRDSIQSLKKVQKNITQQLIKLTQLEQALEPSQDNIANLTLQCDQDWEAYREHYLRKLLTELEAANITLSEQEQSDLLLHETWQSIIHRFETQNLDIPSQVKTDKPTYNSYFILKAYLAVDASFSRQMLPRKPEDITKIVKRLLKG